MSSRPARGAARLAAILDALPDALVLVNGNGTVVNANSIAQQTLESPGAPLVGRGLLDIIPSFDPRRIPGSMRPEDPDPQERTVPTRMTARRTDGTELPVEVTSAQLPAGHSPYASAVEATFADDYAGDELLMLVIRDLSGTLDTEAELARQQRQTEMILRAASEGVIGVDTAGRVVLVNPAAAQLLGHRAGKLGGAELHPLVQHSQADGSPLPFEETPLYDTLASGRKHRARGQVLWTKDGQPVPVDMTTAPVRDGDQLVGAVITFTDRRAQDSLTARHAQLDAVLATGLRGPLEQLRGELSALAADAAGTLWPEANQVLHHLSAGYARMTTLVDNVLSYQRLDAGLEQLARKRVSIDSVIAAGVDGATELIGPGRAQFAVHAPPIDAEVDAERLAQALAHLIADVAGVDATGRAQAGTAPAGDSTIVVAAAQRGDVVRVEVRGPYTGGDPVHAPLVRGIVRLHGGVLQTHEVPGAADGRAYVLEVPVHADRVPVTIAPRPSAADTAGETTVVPVPAQPVRGTAARGITPAAGTSTGTGTHTGAGTRTGTGTRTGAGASSGAGTRTGAATGPGAGGAETPPPVAGRAAPAEAAPVASAAAPERVAVVPVQDTPSGRRRRAAAEDTPLLQPAPAPGAPRPVAPQPPVPRPVAPQPPVPQPPGTLQPVDGAGAQEAVSGGRRRRALASAEEAAPAAAPIPSQATGEQPSGRRRRIASQPTDASRQRPEPQQPRGTAAETGTPADAPAAPAASDPRRQAQPSPEPRPQPQPEPVAPAAEEGGAAETEAEQPVEHTVVAASPILNGSRPQPERPRQSQPALPMPGSGRPADPRTAGVSVQTLGQGIPVGQLAQLAEQRNTPGATASRGLALPGSNAGPRRKLAAPPGEDPRVGADPTPPHGRRFTIGAPAEGSEEGPEPLDGPNGAVEVTDGRGVRLPDTPDAELPPEPLDNPRRLLVWPEPDVSTQQALTDRGYRPVLVQSRQEVDAQIAAYPAALFVDPLTGPITRTALQSLRQAAVAAGVPVLVTAGLGQASRDAAYGADPAVLLKALAPRDSEQHPPRVLLVEERQAIADALSMALERRGMQVAHAATDGDAMELAAQFRPNLVVMDLGQVRRRRAGIIDWLRVNDLLSRTPFVVYTAAELDPSGLHRLSSGETVLFLAERSTSADVQDRIVDLLTKIGAGPVPG